MSFDSFISLTKGQAKEVSRDYRANATLKEVEALMWSELEFRAHCQQADFTKFHARLGKLLPKAPSARKTRSDKGTSVSYESPTGFSPPIYNNSLTK